MSGHVQRRRTPVSCLWRNVIPLPSYTDPYLRFNKLACLKVALRYSGFRNRVSLDTYRCHCVCVCLVADSPNPQVSPPRAGPLKHTPADRAKSANVCVVVEWSVCMCAHHPLYCKAPGSAFYRLWRICVYKGFVYARMYMNMHVTDPVCNCISEFKIWTSLDLGEPLIWCLPNPTVGTIVHELVFNLIFLFHKGLRFPLGKKFTNYQGFMMDLQVV